MARFSLRISFPAALALAQAAGNGLASLLPPRIVFLNPESSILYPASELRSTVLSGPWLTGLTDLVELNQVGQTRLSRALGSIPGIRHPDKALLRLPG